MVWFLIWALQPSSGKRKRSKRGSRSKINITGKQKQTDKPLWIALQNLDIPHTCSSWIQNFHSWIQDSILGSAPIVDRKLLFLAPTQLRSFPVSPVHGPEELPPWKPKTLISKNPTRISALNPKNLNPKIKKKVSQGGIRGGRKSGPGKNS